MYRVLLPLFLLLLAHFCIAQEFLLEAVRETPRSNAVQLRCVTDTELDVTSPDAVFFVNGVSFRELEIRTLPSGDGIVFLITREIEGAYSCALPFDRRTSNSVMLVALPDPQQVPSFPRTFFAEMGSTAVLNCSITPGRLIQQYFVTWQNGSVGGRTLRAIPQPGVPAMLTATPPDPRYSIDPETFSLIISNVELTDSDPNYICVLGVVNPRTNSPVLYENTISTNLQLIVYKPPRIIQPPAPTTISLADTRQVHFNCIALGDPAPTISWRHNGRNTSMSPLMYHVNQFTPTRDPLGRGFIRRGTLGIFPLIEEDSGTVECIAGVVASDETTGGQEVPQDMQGTSLAILGGFRQLDVLVTQEGDVIFKLRLQGVINTPVNLFFSYTEVGGEGDSIVRNRTASATYNGTDSITHIEFNSQIPFQRFRVGVALMNRFVRGPINQTDADVDISQPSFLLVANSAEVKLIVAASVPVAVMFLICVSLISMVCVITCYKRKKAELRFKKKVTKEPRKVVEVLSKTVPKENYPQFLDFATKIVTGTCEVCQNFQITSESRGGVGDKEVEGTEETDGVVLAEEGLHGTDTTRARDGSIPSKMLTFLEDTIKSGLDNTKISRQLTDIMMTQLAGKGIRVQAPDHGAVPCTVVSCSMASHIPTHGQDAGLDSSPTS